ncbi:ribonuclease Y [Spiroplasma sp. TIUS-1]|uniref:HDIG domain-containing metalloprotein n=1 Tax=Spiroplasma sp. TIUS-1 TaxID=216963 RepID=UPI0013980069|nr:HDIG domain-containing metalloprotein [Spiroplasma sp. TIUS-1]QHX35829.1 ribonuclease Y [Spiroplasma sp. TIUS-1]
MKMNYFLSTISIAEVSLISALIICFLIILVLVYTVYKTKNINKFETKNAQKKAKKIYFKIINDARIEKDEILNKAEIKKSDLLADIDLELKRISRLKEEIALEKNKQVRINQGFEEAQNSINNEKMKLNSEILKMVAELETVALMTKDEARDNLEKSIYKLHRDELNKSLNELENISEIKIKQAAQNILISAMQNVSVETTETYNLTFIEIKHEDMKGRIIGKEGRNIKAFQQYGGVDLVIDDGSTKVGISSLNPIRREIATRTLNKLLETGRLQPASIEEELIIQEEKIEQEMREIGQKTVDNLKLENINPRIKYLLGKLKFRSSYAQNVLGHSIEVAQISGLIAAELGLDIELATKCGLFHDIGKAVDFEGDGSHVKMGVNELVKLNEDKIIINAVESHHGDSRKESVYAEIVVIADSISAARIGARNNDIATFIARVKELEDECNKVEGVLKTYALQSGRQIRVIVDAEMINDIDMKRLSVEIENVINRVKKVPGTINVTLIKEKRLSISI